MRAIIIVAFILLSDSLRRGRTESAEEMEGTSVVSNGHSLTFGIYVVYDKMQKLMMSRSRVSITGEEYFNLMIRMVEKTHFGNVSCTNISLIFMGASELNESYNVEKLTSREDLDVEATLPNFRSYSYIHRAKFGYPDLTLLVTGHFTTYSTELCKDGALSAPLRRAYCTHGPGATYFKGMCGNNSVAIASDDGRRFRGVTAIARQITTLLGVSSDDIRNESSCHHEKGYFTSNVWAFATDIVNPGLSSCAVREFTGYINSMKNSNNTCWMDVPNAVIPEKNIAPDNLSDTVDICTWSVAQTHKCEEQKTPGDPSSPCGVDCCDDAGNRHRNFFYPPGRSCGENGVCFNARCIQ